MLSINFRFNAKPYNRTEVSIQIMSSALRKVKRLTLRKKLWTVLLIVGVVLIVAGFGYGAAFSASGLGNSVSNVSLTGKTDVALFAVGAVLTAVAVYIWKKNLLN